MQDDLTNKFSSNKEDSNQSDSLNKIVSTFLKDRKRERRWKIFFRIIWLIIIISIVFSFFSTFNEKNDTKATQTKHIALIKIKGVIADDSDARASFIIHSLSKAIKNKNVEAIVLEINSPGGSPVQSDEIYQYIRYLQKKYKKPIYAVCTDVCASGAYYIASATQEIYANQMTILGSIGVIAGGFGFVDSLKKLGIERRIYTSGNNKDFLDPFLQENKQDVKHFQNILNSTHKVFIDAVKKGRGDRLKLEFKDEIFSGMPFNGIEGRKLGLIDGYFGVTSLMRVKFNNMKYINYTYKESILSGFLDTVSTKVYYKALSNSFLKFE